MTLLGIALSMVIVLSAGVLIYQWWTRILADPLDMLRPLTNGRRPKDDGWRTR